MDVSFLKGSVENQQKLFYIYSSVFLFQILIKRAKAKKKTLFIQLTIAFFFKSVFWFLLPFFYLFFFLW